MVSAIDLTVPPNRFGAVERVLVIALTRQYQKAFLNGWFAASICLARRSQSERIAAARPMTTRGDKPWL